MDAERASPGDGPTDGKHSATTYNANNVAWREYDSPPQSMPSWLRGVGRAIHPVGVYAASACFAVTTVQSVGGLKNVSFRQKFQPKGVGLTEVGERQRRRRPHCCC